MEYPVDQKRGQAFLEIDAGITGLPHRGVCRNDHVAKELGGYPGKPALLHGKRDDVGCPVTIQILLVQRFNVRVVNDKDGEFTVRTAQGV